jgi:hypothetical protein
MEPESKKSELCPDSENRSSYLQDLMEAHTHFKRLVDQYAKTPLREILDDCYFKKLKNEMILCDQNNCKDIEQYYSVFRWLYEDQSFARVNYWLAEYYAKTEFRKSIGEKLDRLSLRSKRQLTSNDMVTVGAAIFELEMFALFASKNVLLGIDSNHLPDSKQNLDFAVNIAGRKIFVEASIFDYQKQDAKSIIPYRHRESPNARTTVGYGNSEAMKRVFLEKIISKTIDQIKSANDPVILLITDPATLFVPDGGINYEKDVTERFFNSEESKYLSAVAVIRSYSAHSFRIYQNPMAKYPLCAQESDFFSHYKRIPEGFHFDPTPK